MPDLSALWFVTGVVAMCWATWNQARAGERWCGWDALLIAAAFCLGPVSLILLTSGAILRYWPLGGATHDT